MSLYASPSLFLWACFFRLVTDLPEIAGPPEQSLTVPAYSLLVSLSGECRMFPPYSSLLLYTVFVCVLMYACSSVCDVLYV